MNNENSDHWLVRPRTIRLIWQVSAAVLVAVVALQFAVKIKGYFGADSWIGFGAIFGFFSCVAMVLLAKALGLVIKRDESYYSREEADD